MTSDYVETYEASFGFFKDYPREAAFLDEVFRNYGAGIASVVDIACGPGHHILELAGLGYACCAADIDPEMLQEVQRAAASRGVTLDTCEVDIRDLHLAKRFDAALNLFYSFQNVLFAPDEQRHFLRSIAASLRPGGLFVIEVLPEENNLRVYPPDQSFVIHEDRRQDGSGLKVTSTSRLVDEQVKEIVISYETSGADGTREYEQFVSPIRRLYLAEFAALVDEAGFRQVGAYGSCAISDPFNEHSRKLVAVLRRE